MKLATLHRILITAAIALGVLCVAYTLYRWLALADTRFLPTGILGAVASTGLVFYLRWFLSKQPTTSSRG